MLTLHVTLFWAKTWRERESQTGLEITIPLTSFSHMRIETRAGTVGPLQGQAMVEGVRVWMSPPVFSLQKDILGMKIPGSEGIPNPHTSGAGLWHALLGDSQPRKRVQSPWTRATDQEELRPLPGAHEQRHQSLLPFWVKSGSQHSNISVETTTPSPLRPSTPFMSRIIAKTHPGVTEEARQNLA